MSEPYVVLTLGGQTYTATVRTATFDPFAAELAKDVQRMRCMPWLCDLEVASLTCALYLLDEYDELTED